MASQHPDAIRALMGNDVQLYPEVIDALMANGDVRLAPAVGRELLAQPDVYCGVFNADGNAVLVARLLREGDRYGLNDCLTWEEKEPGIEFYDGRYPHTPRGQFVSRYYLETLLESVQKGNRGLCLDGGVAAWALNPGELAGAVQWARDMVRAQDRILGVGEGLPYVLNRLEVRRAESGRRWRGLVGYEVLGPGLKVQVAPRGMEAALSFVTNNNRTAIEGGKSYLPPEVLESYGLNARVEGLMATPLDAPSLEVARRALDEVPGGWAVPKAIRRVALDVCGVYGIKGQDEPMYISNLIAYETSLGDGQGEFEPNVETVRLSGDGVRDCMAVAARLLGAYGVDIEQSGRFTSLRDAEAALTLERQVLTSLSGEPDLAPAPEVVEEGPQP